MQNLVSSLLVSTVQSLHKIALIFQGSLSKFSTLREQNLSYTGRVGLIQYRVFDVSFLDFVSDDGEEGIEVQISMGRQLLSQMMSNFLPPFLISIMAFCTSFFDVRNFFYPRPLSKFYVLFVRKFEVFLDTPLCADVIYGSP